ncbi:hypothetical protein CRUP_014218 [Coryphaenoides rupestris]|nr:hypothetical protein CRUP_014218 [Coryphaenoides rupestris]
MPQQKDIVKIAIQMPGAYPQLIQLDQGCYAEDLYKGIQSSDSGVRCDSLKQLAHISTDVSLDILESMVQSSRSLFLHVKQEVTFERLLSHLQVANQQIQTKAMALLMALLQTAEDADRLELSAFLVKKNLRQYIYKNIIHSSGAVGDEMAHYLYVLQSVTLNNMEARMRSPLDCYSQEQRDVLHGLRQSAFEMESENGLSNERRRSLCAKEFRKLGFSNNSNPGQDLVRVPPGLLALDTMEYFSSRYPDAYSRFVLENSSREDKHECPFARSSIQLTLILCEILRIGDPPSETGADYHPIFFSQDRLVEELFCVCIQLLNKTWKEMRATQEDFDKVMQVVREQITRTLSSKPTSLELFKNKVNALNYSEILKLRQTERLHQEETLAPPVVELKERLKPELMELIRQQRLNRLCQGTLFRKISSRRRQDKLWYCRLSPNHKVLHYGDMDEDTENPPIELLHEKIPVADIKALLTGKDLLDLAFSITYDVEECSLNFIASSRTDFCLWTDGLSALLGREMSSESMRSELEILLSMEIKLRLLDLDNINCVFCSPRVLRS